MGKRHGMTGTRLHKIWIGIRSRCNDKKQPAYKDYGGRGIKVCNEWNEFKNFMDWSLKNGYRDSLSIDRVDNNGNYAPNNCRWVDAVTQNRNKRNNKVIEVNGKRMCLMDWSAEFKIPHQTIYDRYKRGVRGEDLLRKKLQSKNEFYVRTKKLNSGKEYYEVHVPVGYFKNKEAAIARRNELLDYLANGGFFVYGDN